MLKCSPIIYPNDQQNRGGGGFATNVGSIANELK